MTDRTGLVIVREGVPSDRERPDAGTDTDEEADLDAIGSIASAVAPAVDELVINCPRESRGAVAEALAEEDLEARFALDPIAGQGAAYGLLTGLRLARGRDVVVVGDDCDWLSTDGVEALFDGLPADGAALPDVGGTARPLCGAYDVNAARDACTTALMRGDDTLRGVLQYLSVAVLAGETVGMATPGERARDEAREVAE